MKKLLKSIQKCAGDVVDLLDKERRTKDKIKERNQRIIDEKKSQDRMNEIMRQHRLDKMQLQNPEYSSELHQVKRDPRNVVNRHEVEVQYPEFREDGSPTFESDNPIIEVFSVDDDELENLKWQEEKGYLKIIQTAPHYSRPRD